MLPERQREIVIESQWLSMNPLNRLLGQQSQQDASKFVKPGDTWSAFKMIYISQLGTRAEGYLELEPVHISQHNSAQADKSPLSSNSLSPKHLGIQKAHTLPSRPLVKPGEDLDDVVAISSDSESQDLSSDEVHQEEEEEKKCHDTVSE